MTIANEVRGKPGTDVPVLRRDRIGTAFWSVSFGAASCFLVLVALLAALA